MTRAALQHPVWLFDVTYTTRRGGTSWEYRIASTGQTQHQAWTSAVRKIMRRHRHTKIAALTLELVGTYDV